MARGLLPAVVLAAAAAAAVVLLRVPSGRHPGGGVSDAFAAAPPLPQRLLRGSGRLAGSRRPGAYRLAPLSGSGLQQLVRSAAEAPERSWVDVRNSPDEKPAGDGEVLPLFPLRVIEWPGNTVEVKVNEPAHRKLYEDLLMSGARRIVAPLVSIRREDEEEDDDTQSHGGDDREAAPAELRLHAVGAVLFLEDLQEVSQKTGGQFKYVAKHSVEGLARIRRVLNPSSFYNKNQQGLKIEYARGEVEVISDTESLKSGFAGEGTGVREATIAADLVEAWEDLRLLAERAEEPRLQSHRFMKETVRKSPTWQLADLWQRLQLSTLVHRERARVTEEVKEWIEVQQAAGRLPRQLPPQLDVTKIGLPAPMVEDFVKAHTPSAMTLRDEFWESLIEILVAETPQARAHLLVKLAKEEIKVTRARVNLKELLG